MNESGNTSGGWKVFVVAGLMLGLVAANGFLLWRSTNLENETSSLRAAMIAEIGEIKDAATSQEAASRKLLDELGLQIRHSQSSVQKFAAVQAKTSAERAQKHADELVQGLADEQKQHREELSQDLGTIKAAHEASNTKVGEVITEVGAVKTEVASTKSSLDATIADLKSVRGDLGIQSGLIATNSKELAALRELGERNYHEFNLTKAQPLFKAAGVAITLKKADLKRNKVNLDLVANDKRVEKKDKNVNEPVQFYAGGGRMPYEIVVNEIKKDQVIGYLATPKVMQARR